jgi:hypothetical protein
MILDQTKVTFEMNIQLLKLGTIDNWTISDFFCSLVLFNGFCPLFVFTFLFGLKLIDLL